MLLVVGCLFVVCCLFVVWIVSILLWLLLRCCYKSVAGFVCMPVVCPECILFACMLVACCFASCFGCLPVVCLSLFCCLPAVVLVLVLSSSTVHKDNRRTDEPTI